MKDTSKMDKRRRFTY